MAMCKMFHEDVRGLSEQYKREAGRINYVTPTSYLELITAFTTLLASKRAEVRDMGGGQGRHELCVDGEEARCVWGGVKV